ncbi:MAG: hypothetical protein WAV46_03295 [Candidatus Moraniibacteriota bacterium]
MFEIPKIVPDQEQAQVWAKVKGYFESVLEGEEESPLWEEETLVGLHDVLNAIDESDWSKAYEYFEREIGQLEARYEMVRENDLAKKIGTPELLKGEIARLEDLKSSLLLEEK